MDTKQKTETAYSHYQRVKYELDQTELDKLFGPGEEYQEGVGFDSVIKTDCWAPLVRLSDGEPTGLCVRTRGRKLKEIANEAAVAMEELVDEYFNFHCYGDLDAEGTWPEGVRWVAVFPVTGGSEGHYVHVELVRDNGNRSLFMLGKTFNGMEHAKAMCSRLIDLFGC